MVLLLFRRFSSQRSNAALLSRLNLRWLYENRDEVLENAKKRKTAMSDVFETMTLYERYASIRKEIESNRQSRHIAAEKTKGEKDSEKRQLLQVEGKRIRETIDSLESALDKVADDLCIRAERLPNMTHPESPIGDETQGNAVYIHGEKPEFDFTPKDHFDLCKSLDIVDFASASQVAGPSFYYLKGAAALLELALVQWAVNKLISKGFAIIATPDVIKENVMAGCGFHPKGENTQIYHLDSRHGDLCMTGTAEVPLAGMFMGKCLVKRDLPKKLAAYGRCFRAEAGGRGQSARGLYRVHQFTKVEMFGVTSNEGEGESNAILDEFVNIQEEMYDELGLHYRIVDMASEDLGASAYRKYDLEAWMPGREQYGELCSASNCTDYQARRLDIRYEQNIGRGKRKFVHTVNGTACAVPRTILAILETFQQKNGSIAIPKVLQEYLGVKNGRKEPHEGKRRR
ncbi:serine--tRNA ligase-like [Oscarella lobularis]|uniref:serine--tRNA ligase-like n=1 Tax=Oscarella lobularis TaxID=121494 RepID=UPI003313294C